MKKAPTSRKGSVDSFAGLTAGLAHLLESAVHAVVLSGSRAGHHPHMLSEKTGLHITLMRETLSVLMEAGLVRRSQVTTPVVEAPRKYETSMHPPGYFCEVMKNSQAFALCANIFAPPPTIPCAQHRVFLGRNCQ